MITLHTVHVGVVRTLAVRALDITALLEREGPTGEPDEPLRCQVYLMSGEHFLVTESIAEVCTLLGWSS